MKTKILVIVGLLFLQVNCSKKEAVEIKEDLASQIEGFYSGELTGATNLPLSNHFVKVIKVDPNTIIVNSTQIDSLKVELVGDIQLLIEGKNTSELRNFTYLVQEEELSFLVGLVSFNGNKTQ